MSFESELKVLDKKEAGLIDLTNLPLEIDIPDMEQISNDEYIMHRRKGLGTSDSSVILGVNPYKDVHQLIDEKLRSTISEEERAVGKKTAVVKGKDLEPLIIKKWSKFANKLIIKPDPQYKHKEFPFLKFNFDGVSYNPELKSYIPDEIKFVTYRGESHYDTTKEYFSEEEGFFNIPDDYGKTNNSIQTKAALYGVPPYYYTQVQQQILGLNAPYGFLAVMFERTWKVHVFWIWRDNRVISQIISKGAEVWDAIESAGGPASR